MAQELPQLNPGATFEGRYNILKKLGEGGFGGVYLVKDTRNADTVCALKVEGANEQIQLLKMEVYVMETLKSKNASRHFAAIIDKGRTASCNYIVMSLLGKSLEALIKMRPDGKFSISTALRIGILCLEALEDMHSIGYLHRDVKPANFAMGRAEIGEQRKLYVLDFGMCREYINRQTGKHRRPRKAAGFRGTVRYAPLNCHHWMELSRRDDLETWLYQQCEMTNGRLPWSNLQGPEEVGKYKERVRLESNIKELCGGCPRFYINLLRLIDGLGYYDQPPYQQIYAWFRDCLAENGGKESDPFDWEMAGGMC